MNTVSAMTLAALNAIELENAPTEEELLEEAIANGDVKVVECIVVRDEAHLRELLGMPEAD